MTAQRIEITLHGSNGTRTAEVSARGFTTRHVTTPREAVPSIFSPVNTPDTPAITPAPVIETTTPVETPQNAIGARMTDLIAEVDSITNVKPAGSETGSRPADTRQTRRVEKQWIISTKPMQSAKDMRSFTA